MYGGRSGPRDFAGRGGLLCPRYHGEVGAEKALPLGASPHWFNLLYSPHLSTLKRLFARHTLPRFRCAMLAGSVPAPAVRRGMSEEQQMCFESFHALQGGDSS